MALGGVYVPSTSDAIGALTTNPAGLTYLSSPTLDLSMSAVFARGSFSDSVNNNSPMTTSPGVIPYGAFGMPIGKSRFSFGVGFAPDMVSVSDWNYVDAPGKGGVTYGMQENKSAILAGRAMAGLSYAFSHKLSVGVTAGADYNSNTLQAPYIFQSQPVLAGDKTLLDLHTYGTGWNMSVGAMFEPTKNLDFGVAWKSHTVIVTNGLASGNAYALFGAPPGTAADAFAYNASVKNILPQSVNANIAWHVNPRWVLAFQTDWVNWSNAFVNLPVTLTNGTNATINGAWVPRSLDRRRAPELERSILLPRRRRADADREHFAAVRLCAWQQSCAERNPHADDRGHHDQPAFHRFRLSSRPFALRYRLHVRSHLPSSRCRQSNLLAGEYNNSTDRVGLQSLSLGYTFQF